MKNRVNSFIWHLSKKFPAIIAGKTSPLKPFNQAYAYQ